ncbi:MAG: S8 family serine peptidase [Sphingomonadaceae bacterium]
MNTKILLGLAAATGALCAATPAAAQAIPNSYICSFDKAQVNKGQVRAEAVRSANAQGGQVKFVYEHSIRGFAVNISAQGAARLQAMGKIKNCEQDQVAKIVLQGKGKPGGGGGGSDPAQTTPWGIARVGGPGGTSSATAWIIDSGIDLDHPDLNVDVSRSVNYTRDKSADDLNGHGTHVAGTVAAIDNGIGVVGVAPGTTVVAVKVLDRRGSGSYSGVIAGIDYVAANGSNGDVANMSLGGGYSAELNAAVEAAAATGVKFVLAAGNESTDAATKSPASANGPNVYTISSFAQGDNWSSFSNYGNPPVDFAEPGSAILSTYKDGGYATLSGTSMASPHAAGILLLGGIRADGTVSGDPDGNPDTIGVR